MKTAILTLVFSALAFAPAFAQPQDEPCCNDSLMNTVASTSIPDEELAPDLDSPFWFQEKVYIHIYDRNDQPLLEGAFSSKDLKENQELKDLLRKSTRFLNIDSHHYYMLDEE